MRLLTLLPALLLFAALLCDAAACRKYMQLALPHLDTVFASADDPRLAFRVVLAGTAPSTTDAAVAGPHCHID